MILALAFFGERDKMILQTTDAVVILQKYLGHYNRKPNLWQLS